MSSRQFDKSCLQQRLANSSVIDDVLPTRPILPGNGVDLEVFSRSIQSGDLAFAEETSVNAMPDELNNIKRKNAITDLMQDPDLQPQLAAFTRAGLNFFHAPRDLIMQPMERRRQLGANETITRVIKSESRMLLETRRLIIGFNTDVDADSVAEIERRYDLIFIDDLAIGKRRRRYASLHEFSTELCIHLMSHDEIEFAEPDYIEHLGHRAVPNYPLQSQQWHLDRINCPAAWSVNSANGVKIAIIDNGFFVGHPDLNINPDYSGWFRSTAGRDDADFVNDFANMMSGNHGTACAGMAAAVANGLDGVGVAFDADLRVIACAEDQVSTQTTLARALLYTIDPSTEDSQADPNEGADVISCSLGPSEDARWTMRRILEEAIYDVADYGRNQKGTPLFWACTNGNFPIMHDEICSHEEIIVVGRSTRNDSDDGSGYGPELDFLAPGVDVLIPANRNGYKAQTGTSFAAPCASGVAALVLAKNPSLSAHEIRQILRDSCDKVGSVNYTDNRHDRFGYGRVNAELALAYTP